MNQIYLTLTITLSIINKFKLKIISSLGGFFRAYCGIIFALITDLNKKLYSLKVNQFFFLEKMFQNFLTKIEIIGTCLNLREFPKESFGL